MPQNIIIPRLTFINEKNEIYENIIDVIKELIKLNHKIIFVSHNSNYRNELIDYLQSNLDTKNSTMVISRKSVKELIKENHNQSFIMVGSSDEDLHLASSNKILLINPGWSEKQDEKPQKYAVTLFNPYSLLIAIKLIENQNTWYFQMQVDEKTSILALTSANTLNYHVGKSEKEVLEGFNDSLKSGDRKWFNTLFFHLISGVMKDQILRETDIWGVFPTSSGVINEEVEELKERCRYLTGKRMKEPLFIRHTSVRPSRETNHHKRLEDGCKKHFDSIVLNPYYKNRIKDKTICIIDDYITNGTSFETVRNLLISAGANKIILLALGRYRKGTYGVYQKEDYDIKMDVTRPGYQYVLKEKNNITGAYNERARNEVENIYNILYND